jgi:predicted GIY-YIG superfamily endonuclease
MTWYVYIVRCSDGTLYTGIAKDINKRMQLHNEGKGAKYTRGRRPVELVWSMVCGTKGSAQIIERLIKKQPRKNKLLVIELFNSLESI